MSYRLIPEPPDVESYRRVRVAAGLQDRTPEAATAGLAGTWFGVSIFCEDEIVGIGRVIGDGGCFFQVVDIAVLPAHQGKGLGKRIMGALMEHLEEHAPSSAYVSLIADGEARRLYQQFGFIPTAPQSMGMYREF